MGKSKDISTPLEPNIKLVKPSKADEEEMKKYPYQELIGCLMYLAVATRPDISYAVSYLSQFNNCYSSEHWKAAKRVLRYLKGTCSYGITYKRSGGTVHGFADADWASCPNDRRSYTGYTYLLGNGAISWESRKQRTVATSSTEAEYMSLSEASKEAIHLRSFLHELEMFEGKTIKLHVDNQGAMKLAENQVYHSKTKHIDARYHFVRNELKEGRLQLEYTPTKDMVADIFTKSLPKVKHNFCRDRLGISKCGL